MPIAAIAVWVLVLYGTYRMVEKIFLVACAFYGTYVLSGPVSQARLAAGEQEPGAAAPHLASSDLLMSWWR